MNILYNLTRKQILLYSAVVLTVVVALIFTLFAVNFRHTYPKELVAVDSLIESRPDSARLLLGRLSPRDCRSESDRMYYGPSEDKDSQQPL